MKPRGEYSLFLVFGVVLVVLLPNIALAETTKLFGTSIEAVKNFPKPLQILSTFGFGFLSSLTPCVYPLIPITLAIFGAHTDISRKHAFLLSLTYVFGIAMTYTTLGMLSAFTGKLFGSLLGNPYVIGSMCFLLVLLSLFSMDIFTLRFGSSVENKANKVGGKGFTGAFTMGLVSGVIAAPCVGPILVFILQFAALSQDPIWGGALLFSYSLGLGVLFVLLGTFSGLIKKLPRSGNWLSAIKFGLSSCLLLVAIFLGSAFIGDYSNFFATSGYFNLLFIFCAASVFLATVGYKKDLKLVKVVALVLFSLSLYPIIMTPAAARMEDVALSGNKIVELSWIRSLEDSVATAKSANKIAMVDLYAEWCAACKEFEHITFVNPEVREELQKFTIGRVDFTTETKESMNIQDKYTVIGLPTILFLDGSGNEIPESRITGFLKPVEFIEHLEAVKKKLNL